MVVRTRKVVSMRAVVHQRHVGAGGGGDEGLVVDGDAVVPAIADVGDILKGEQARCRSGRCACR